MSDCTTVVDRDLNDENTLQDAHLACCMQVFDASCGISMMARSAKKYENDVVA